ncbi:GDSL-type esterase/lipase family protein [Microbacterium sp. NPDC056044]|uniref:GDSL-type esterase/lipase family protein n=1 Tax=Microbacterium sp. NPDC056044 TaxID=3345690 RepID=UPI0035D8DD5E
MLDTSAHASPAAPVTGPRRKKRRALRITLLASAVVIVLAVVGGAITLWYFGHDDPAQYEERVDAIDQRFSDGYPQGQVLLSGSSFFEFWETSTEDLAPLPTTNIGIGGTKVIDHLTYFDRMVVPFAPRTLVLYIGSNDMGGIPLYTKSAEHTVGLIEQYIAEARAKLPGATVYYVAVTEAPARAGVRSDIQQANAMLAERARETGDFTFIDTAPTLLNADGSIDGTLFGPDRLHFNEKGYERFAAAVRQGLAPEYARDWSATTP